jgi:hypothetical protein
MADTSRDRSRSESYVAGKLLIRLEWCYRSESAVGKRVSCRAGSKSCSLMSLIRSLKVLSLSWR